MIKVGDWVKYKSTGEIARARVVDNDKYINGVCIDDCIKLPIKFKPFQIKQGEEDIAYIIEETRVLHKNTRAIKFKAVQIHEGGLCEVILHTDGKTQTRWEKNSKTIEQAKDWLELQYATMIVEARGLV